MERNGIAHMTSSPYHPQSNGLAERMVQAFKSGMKKMSEGTVETKLTRFLFSYRSTPHTTTGVSPAELMFGRRLRTRFDLLQPDTGERVLRKQEKQKDYFDRRAKQRKFELNDNVYVRNFSPNCSLKWIPGKIMKLNGNVSYTVQLDQSKSMVRRHQNHMKKRHIERIPELEATLPSPIVSVPTSTAPRYPQRNRHPPLRYSDES